MQKQISKKPIEIFNDFITAFYADCPDELDYQFIETKKFFTRLYNGLKNDDLREEALDYMEVYVSSQKLNLKLEKYDAAAKLFIILFYHHKT